jgi:hypothetical protein
MKLLTLSVLALCISTIIFAQGLSPYRAFSAGGAGGDSAAAVAVDVNGYVYLAGHFRSTNFVIGSFALSNAGGADAFLAKIDTAGNVLWVQRFGGAADESITALTTDAAGNVYAVGVRFTLTKLSSAGSIVWQGPANTGGGYTTISLDTRGNVYAGNNAGFIKCRADGSYVFAKSVPVFANSGDFYVDRYDEAHLMFHSNGGTVVNGTQTFNVNLATQLVYDTTGYIVASRQISTLPRWYPVGYKARSRNDYYITASYPTLSPIWYMGLGRNLTGEFGYGSCAYKKPVNPDWDELGNQFYAGNLGPGTAPTCPFPIAPVLSISSMNQIEAINGNDIFYIHRFNGKDSGFSTRFCGNTDESAMRIVHDSARGRLYIAGFWAKRHDTAAFRFGSSTIFNAGAANTTDALLLTLRYNPGSPLRANAGFDQVVCLGGSVQLSGNAAGGSGNYTYAWSPSAGLNNASVANPVATPSGSTQYILTVTDASGAIARDTVLITVSTALFKPTISLLSGSTNPFCEGQQITLVGSPASSYQWNTGSSFNSISVSSSGTFSLTATNSQGCIGTSDPFVAVMKPRTSAPTITPAANSAGQITACMGSSVTLTANSSQGGVSFRWNNNATTPSITVSNAGTYSVVTTDTSGCPSLPVTAIVHFNSLPVGAINAHGSTNLCQGDSVRLQIQTDATNKVLWSNGDTARSIWIKSAGVYAAQLTSQNGCVANATGGVTVQVQPRPNPVISQTANMLTVLPAASSYQWFLNNTSIPGATAQTLNINAGGSYSVSVTNASGCTATASQNAILRVLNPDLSYQIYPNPSNGQMGILYTLNQPELVSISVLSPEGRSLKRIVNNQQQSAGEHQYTLNSNEFPKGLVIIEFRVGNRIVHHRQIIL